MSRVIDVRSGGGDLVILGKALVLPASETDGTDLPLDGSIRFNPNTNAIEVYSVGSWAPLGSGSGGTAAHTHPISQITGLQSALNQKAGVAHVHTFSEITGLQSALDEKASSTHIHGIAQIQNLQETLNSMQSQFQTGLDSKANTSHNHTFSQVTGLQTKFNEIDSGKANAVHTHSENDIGGLPARMALALREQINISVSGNPAAGLRVHYVTSIPITIPNNMAGSILQAHNSPAAFYQISIRQNGIVVGSARLDEGGFSSFLTVNSVGIILNPGDRLEFLFPATQDSQIDTVALSLLGNRRLN
jgi:hypothetical protein